MCHLDDAIEQLKKVKTFVTNTHRLANILNIKDRDAEELIVARLFNEFRKEFDRFIMRSICNEPVALWHITYKTKDIIRDYFQSERRQQATKNELQYIDFGRGVSYVQQNELDKVIAIVPKIFRNKKTQMFVEQVLEFGEKETTARLNISKRQFSMKLCAVERYCRNNPQKLIGIAISREEQEIMTELESINAMINQLESEKYNDQLMSDYLHDLYNQQDEGLTNILDTPKIKRPLKVILNFGDESIKSECYIFVNRLYARQYKLKARLNRRETSSLL